MPYRDMSEDELEHIRKELVAGGYPEYWPELADLLKEEANYTCEVCSDTKFSGKLVHHIDGNPSNCDLDNLVVLCVICHSRKEVSVWKFKGRKDFIEKISMAIRQEQSLAIKLERPCEICGNTTKLPKTRCWSCNVVHKLWKEGQLDKIVTRIVELERGEY